MTYSHGERLALIKTIDDLVTDKIDFFLIDNIRLILNIDDVLLIKSRDLNDELRMAIIDNMTLAKRKSFVDSVLNETSHDVVTQPTISNAFQKLLNSLSISSEKV